MKNTILPAAIAAMLPLFFSCAQDGPAEPEIPAELDNAIEYNGRITALGSRFVDPDDGMIYLVAQEGVTSAADLQDLDCGYVSIDTGADSWLGADVVEIDLTSLPSGFSLTYIDDGAVIVNVSAANPGAVVSDGLTFRADAGAESVSLSGTLDFSVTLADGNVLRGNALLPEVREDEGGESAYPEEPNELTYMGVTETIESVLVDKTGGALWEIWVSTESGLDTVADFEGAGSVHITVPEAAFNYGEAVGFSTFKDTMKFEYDGKTWQYDGGNTLGSLEVSLDGDQIALDFTTYGDLSGHYEGTAVIVG